MSDVYALLDELAAAFLRGGHTEEAAKVKQYRADLSTGSQLDRLAAAEAAKLKAAAMQEVGMTVGGVG